MKRKYFAKVLLILLFSFFSVKLVFANSDLLYFEIQGAVGSLMSYKNERQFASIGLSYEKSIFDFTAFSAQTKLIYDKSEINKLQFQFYDLYILLKGSEGNFWIGHNKLAFGLPSYMDTYSKSLQLLSDYSFNGYDWGIGYYIDVDNGDLKLSLTSGSGMPIVFNKKNIYDSNIKTNENDFKGNNNLLGSVRASIGFLEKDNYNLGISFMFGNIVDSINYHFINYETSRIKMMAVDGSFNIDNIENKFELNYGKKNQTNERKTIFNIFYRFSINLFDNKLKLDEQIIYKKNAITNENQLFLGSGISYEISQDIIFNGMFEYNIDEQKIMGQINIKF